MVVVALKRQPAPLVEGGVAIVLDGKGIAHQLDPLGLNFANVSVYRRNANPVHTAVFNVAINAADALDFDTLASYGNHLGKPRNAGIIARPTNNDITYLDNIRCVNRGAIN